MPTYHLWCRKDRGGCGQTFKVTKSIASRYKAICPGCGQYGGRVNRRGERIFDIIPPKIQQRRDIDHMDGNTGSDIPMPAFGPDARISSRRQLSELQKRAREIMWNRTAGSHETWVKDPDTGKKEKVTVESSGIDVGEIHTLDSKPKHFDHHAHAVKQVREQIAKERG